MPQDSIMDMVNNIEEMYNDKIAMFDKWVEDGDDWEKREARAEATALARHYARSLEQSEYIDGKYSDREIHEAAGEMMTEFEGSYREEAIQSRMKEAARKPTPEDLAMDPGDVEHAKKYEELAREIGVEKVRSLIPVSAQKVRAALARGDKHLNSIPLRKWDMAALALHLPGKRLSFSEGVCVLKHVAKWHYA